MSEHTVETWIDEGVEGDFYWNIDGRGRSIVQTVVQK